MTRIDTAVALAKLELANGTATENEKLLVLAQAQAERVTNSEYLFAHALLKILREEQHGLLITTDDCA